MEGGLDRLFALETQKTTERPVGFTITSPTELQTPADNPHHLDFNGAMGAYYREIYLYIPWLIARALRRRREVPGRAVVVRQDLRLYRP